MSRRMSRTAAAIALSAIATLGAGCNAPRTEVQDLDVNLRNADGSTPLQWAVYKGDAAEVKQLVRDGNRILAMLPLIA